MSEQKPTKPDVMTYLSIHQYLANLYRFRKQTEKGFSYEAWARELGIKTKSFLHQIVLGQRAITPETLTIFLSKLKLSDLEKEYFKYLVHYSKAESQEEKNLYGQKLVSMIKSHYQQEEISHYYEFLATTLLPKLQTLLSFKDIDRRADGVAKLLKISSAEAAGALEKLKELGLAQTDEHGQWESQAKAFKVPDELGSSVVLQYHEQSLQEAIQAMTFTPDLRRYKSLLMPLKQSEFQSFLEELQNFVRQSLNKYDVDNLHERRLYQVNFNIYAVSEEGHVPESRLQEC